MIYNFVYDSDSSRVKLDHSIVLDVNDDETKVLTPSAEASAEEDLDMVDSVTDEGEDGRKDKIYDMRRKQVKVIDERRVRSRRSKRLREYEELSNTSHVEDEHVINNKRPQPINCDDVSKRARLEVSTSDTLLTSASHSKPSRSTETAVKKCTKKKVVQLSLNESWLKPKHCPICKKTFPAGTSNLDLNQHIDNCLIE